MEPSPTAPASRPIGVFDSGVGGLTVVAALRELLPGESIFYLGDTARVPYGGKSRATIERYTLEIAGLLLAEHAKALVVACNTATALALPRLQESVRTPSVGVIGPGAQAAVEATKCGRIGVIGTRATIASRAYERALQALAPTVEVHALACPLFVPLVEEGWLEDPVTDAVIERYLTPLRDAGIDTLVLGCTHYPFLHERIARFLGPEIAIVDSARNCAVALKDLLEREGLVAGGSAGRLEVALTDPPGAFLGVANARLGLGIGQVQERAVQGVQRMS
ncbi:MAG: glutamate racemase [Verrucomicrobia bacterium]|nr:glutamate racemase [Verrucomicrobiota bacterium]